MNLRNRSLAILVVAAAGAFSTGCTDATTSVFVRNVIAPEVSDGACSFNPDPSQPGLFGATLNYAYAQEYRSALSVGNQLAERGDPDTLKPESNRVQFYEAEVEVYDFSGGQLSAYTVPASGFADPAAGDQPSFGAVEVTLIDPVAAEGAAATPGQTVVSRVIVRGITLGGTEVETAPWDFPIKIINEPCADVGTPEECDEEMDQNFCFLGQDNGAHPLCPLVEALTGADVSMCGM